MCQRTPQGCRKSREEGDPLNSCSGQGGGGAEDKETGDQDSPTAAAT